MLYTFCTRLVCRIGSSGHVAVVTGYSIALVTDASDAVGDGTRGQPTDAGVVVGPAGRWRCERRRSRGGEPLGGAIGEQGQRKTG